MVLPPERKARRIAETQAAAFSVEQWEQIFNEAVAYHSEHYRGEGASHPAEQVVPVLAELGYSSCWLGGDSINFKFGGGFMQNVAYVNVMLGTETNPWSGVIHGGSGTPGEIRFGDSPDEHDEPAENAAPPSGDAPDDRGQGRMALP